MKASYPWNSKLTRLMDRLVKDIQWKKKKLDAGVAGNNMALNAMAKKIKKKKGKKKLNQNKYL